MNRELFFKLITALLFSCLLLACENQNYNDFQNGKIEFSFQLNSGNLKSSLDSCESLYYASKVLLTIQTISGGETDYTDYELTLYKLNGNFLSPKISLLVGQYRLTKLLLLDQGNHVLFASPLEGSLLAQNVENPLPVEFEVIKDQAVSVNVEVICALAYTPEDFGLTSFWFNKVETFPILLAVTELGEDLILDAELSVTSDSYVYNQHLEAIANNVVALKDGYENYTLMVTKEGYYPYEKSFSNAELKEFIHIPLVIELVKFKPLHEPVLEVQISGFASGLDMHITSDGQYYYLMSQIPYSWVGGIYKYTLDGTQVAYYPFDFDGFGLSYNKLDGFLYASTRPGNVVRITDLEEGLWEMVYENKLQSEQPSFAISPDGRLMYDFYKGTLKIWDFLTGNLLDTWIGLSYGTAYFDGWAGNACVSVDQDYIYTWDANIQTIYVYDRITAESVTSWVIPYGLNGFSLSVFDGYLFVSDDEQLEGPYNPGENWFGYNIRNEISKSAIMPVITNSSKLQGNMLNKDATIGY